MIIEAIADSRVRVPIEICAGKRLVPSQAELLHLKIIVLDDNDVCRLRMVHWLGADQILQWHSIWLVKLGQDCLAPSQPVKGSADLGELGELFET